MHGLAFRIHGIYGPRVHVSHLLSCISATESASDCEGSTIHFYLLIIATILSMYGAGCSCCIRLYLTCSYRDTRRVHGRGGCVLVRWADCYRWNWKLTLNVIDSWWPDVAANPGSADCDRSDAVAYAAVGAAVFLGAVHSLAGSGGRHGFSGTCD